jgi:hypothetical protein
MRSSICFLLALQCETHRINSASKYSSIAGNRHRLQLLGRESVQGIELTLAITGGGVAQRKPRPCAWPCSAIHPFFPVSYLALSILSCNSKACATCRSDIVLRRVENCCRTSVSDRIRQELFCQSYSSKVSKAYSR